MSTDNTSAVRMNAVSLEVTRSVLHEGVAKRALSYRTANSGGVFQTIACSSPRTSLAIEVGPSSRPASLGERSSRTVRHIKERITGTALALPGRPDGANVTDTKEGIKSAAILKRFNNAAN